LTRTRAPGCSSIIFAGTAAYLAAGLLAYLAWQITGNSAWVEDFFRVPGAWLSVWLAGI